MSQNKEQNAIVCDSCKKEYTNLFSLESGQAYGCSSDLIKKDGKMYSLSHYGSRFDMIKFNFQEQGTFAVGDICDECIQYAIDEFIANEDKDFNYFG